MSRPCPCVPWDALPEPRARAVVGVLTDIDDTLTEAGVIAPQALRALDALHDAGLPVIAVTGRPVGWSTPYARDWPVQAIVAENGAAALCRRGSDTVLEFAQDEATRRRHARRLSQVADLLRREVPGAALARDSDGRVTDIAIDHSEFAHLNAAQIDACAEVMRAQGMTVSISSIHLNGWFGTHSKLSGARWIVRRLLGRDLDAERDRWVYVGDSTNDQEMFAHFALSVGVANLLRFESQLTRWPTYLTRGARGQGFAEVAQRLLDARAAGRA